MDDKNSWIIPFAKEIVDDLNGKNYHCQFFHDAKEIPRGDILFLLGCIKKVKKDILARNKNNLVIHESDLPVGRGWSPVAWQVLAGKNKIPITVFEAEEALDSGPVYMKDYIHLEGTELLPEIKEKQGRKTKELVLKMVEKYPDLHGQEQTGESSYYPRRTRKDDRLDIDKSIKDHFNHLRIVDNEKYPAWFEYKNQRYILKIYKDKE